MLNTDAHYIEAILALVVAANRYPRLETEEIHELAF
jgi:hypothetical protein